jgi:large repetitive protein
MRMFFSTPIRSRSLRIPFFFFWTFFLASLLSIPDAKAGEVVARWSPNGEPNIVGYRVYYGLASRNYYFYVDAGKQTTCTISNLEEGKTYYFASTAYDASGYESDYSAESVYTVPQKLSISPTSQSFSAAGGNGKVNVSASPGAAWTAVSNAPWLLVTSNAAGTGNGIVPYSVQANPDFSPRSGRLNIAGAAFNVTQAALSPPAVQPVFAVNCGGPKYVDKSGVVYQADTGFVGGRTYSTTSPIAGTDDVVLYQSERYGSFSYKVPVANGNYTVTLKFAELYNYTPGSRVFSVKVEGKEVITKLDLYAKVGKYRTYDVPLPASVTDGVLNIEFLSVVGNAKVNAILVAGAGSIPQYTITASATGEGTITPQGEVKLIAGSSQAFTMTPNTGYHIADVQIDGISKGAISTFTFTDINAPHTIQASFEANPPNPPFNQPVFTANCGGPKYVDKSGIIYQADTGFVGGGTYSTTSPIGGTDDALLYQSERWGNFSYKIPVPNGNYTVTLKFAELYNYTPGSRVFSVKVEGKEVITKLDLYAQVGRYRAYDVQIPANVADGLLDIEFLSIVGNAKVNAILVTSSGAITQYTITATAGTDGTVTPQGEVKVNAGSSQDFTINPNTGYRISDVKVDGTTKGPASAYTFTDINASHTIAATFVAESPTNQPVFAVNCGGPRYVNKTGIIYQADTGFVGGGTYSTTNPIGGTDDALLYQSERWGNFSYNIPVTNGNYTVTLKFAEIYPYSSQGSRVFDVKIEGKEVISNLDLFVKAGKFKAYDVAIPVTATDGMLNIDFQADAGSAKISAIVLTKN